MGMARRFPRLKLRRLTAAAVLTLISVALLTVAAILVTTGLMPVGTTAQTPNFTDWLSAIGQAVGALGTAGALGLGAYTFLLQVREQHRAQAAAVSLRLIKRDAASLMDIAEVINSSKLPIYDVKVKARDHNWESLKGDVKSGQTEDVVIETLVIYFPFGKLSTAFVDFTDSNRAKWTRWATGGLAERKSRKDGTQVLSVES